MTAASWKYSAEDASGAVVSGVIDAPDEQAAIGRIRDKRLSPLTLERARRAATFSFALSDKSALSLPDCAAATQRLSDLLSAGLPLAKALSLARDQATTTRQKEFFAHLEQEARAGRALSEALAGGNVKAPHLMIALVRAGENLGTLGEQFAGLAAHYANALKLRREIAAQLVYPAALTVLIILTLVFLSFFVLPQFEAIFENAGAAPPFETRIALAGGAFIRDNIAFFPLAALAALFLWSWTRTRYRSAIENILLNTPVWGKLRRDAELGRYCRALSTMLAGGMSLSDVMPLAADTIQLRAIRRELDQLETFVRAGGRLSAGMARFTSPSKEMIGFLEVGDETGELANMAGQAAKFAEERERASIKRFMSLLGPGLTAVMGLITASVIASVMSGVLSLNDAIY